jgi:hypothetical protein
MPQAAFIDWPAFTTLDRLLNRLRVEIRVWLHDDAVSGLAAMNVCSAIQSREPSVCESAPIDAHRHPEFWAARFGRGGRWAMLIVQTIGRIRREHLVKGKSIKEIVRDMKISRNTVRRVLRKDD